MFFFFFSFSFFIFFSFFFFWFYIFLIIRILEVFLMLPNSDAIEKSLKDGVISTCLYQTTEYYFKDALVNIIPVFYIFSKKDIFHTIVLLRSFQNSDQLLTGLWPYGYYSSFLNLETSIRAISRVFLQINFFSNI